MIVKICGLKQVNDLRMALELGANFVGMIMGVPESPRNNSIGEAEKLIEASDGKEAKRAILFRSSPLNEVKAVLEALRPEVVHLCGSEDSAYRASLKESFPEIVQWQSVGVPVDHPNNLDWKDRTRSLFDEPHVEGVVLDAAKGGKTGGVGKAFPLEMIRSELGKDCERLILAGGLNPENIEERVSFLNPAGVDVSSGVEIRPGEKDRGQMELFFKKLRGAL